MSNEKETLLLDSPSWQTTAMIYWNGELNKLQDFVTSSTFAPHWREFDFYWLISGHEDIKASPPPREMIEQCIKEWTSGRIRYYMIRPDRASWKERTGLGHYVRLLSMIVRENMAVDGTWKVTEDEKVLEGYFTEAFALINCMRDEWKNKGKLYGYLIDPKLGLWVQEVPFDRENIITGSKAPALASIPNITIGKAGPTNDEKDPVDVKEIKAPSPLTPQSAFEIDHKQAGLRPLQISDLPPKSTDISPQSPVGNGIQIKGRMKKEEDVISPFLDSLGEELQQRKLEELRNKLSLQPKLPKVVTAANGKRSAPTEDEGDLKRRKGNHTDSPISSKPSVGNDPTNAPKQTVKQETA